MGQRACRSVGYQGARRSPAGRWSAAVVEPLAAGRYPARVEQTDLAGNVGASAAVTFTVAAGASPAGYAQRVGEVEPVSFWRLGEASGTVAANERPEADGDIGPGVVLALSANVW